MIHVGFCASNLFSKFVGTAILSMFDNHTPPHLPSITVHILHDNTFTQDNRDKFIYLAEQYGQLVKFYNVEEFCADKLEEMRKAFPNIDKTRFTITPLYRLFFPFILPLEIEKAIFLDGDIIVNLDIHELWKIELDDKFFGAVYTRDMGTKKYHDKVVLEGNVKAEDYTNTGVMLMNLKLLRAEEETIANGINFSSEHKYNEFVDQGILNYCFATRILKLPVKFNRYFWMARKEKETFVGQKIYHYTGGGRCGLKMTDPFNRMWIGYFMKTPWFNEDAIGNLYEGFLKVRDNLLSRIARVSAIVSGKTRAFFVEPSKIESMKEFFSIRDDEIIIPAENKDSIQKLINAMKASKGKCVFFIMTPKFLKKKFPFNLLTKKGFTLDKDFVKGWEFLSGAYGNPLDSYPLIQNM